MRISDWSSDVCSSDLHLAEATTQQFELVHRIPGDRGSQCGPADDQHFKRQRLQYRPERTTRDHETAKDAHQQYHNPDCSEHWQPSPSTERRSEEHTSELQSLMRISYAVFCLKKKTQTRL